MRVTAEQKRQTRERILECARKLFSDKGFEQTTTRDIAEAARIASGTMFNYFPTKEALAMTIVDESLGEAGAEFEDRMRGDETLEINVPAGVTTGTAGPVAERHMIRAYWNCPPAFADELVARLTRALEDDALPYTLKCPATPELFARVDALAEYAPDASASWTLS